MRILLIGFALILLPTLGWADNHKCFQKIIKQTTPRTFKVTRGLISENRANKAFQEMKIFSKAIHSYAETKMIKEQLEEIREIHNASGHDAPAWLSTGMDKKGRRMLAMVGDSGEKAAIIVGKNGYRLNTTSKYKRKFVDTRLRINTAAMVKFAKEHPRRFGHASAEMLASTKYLRFEGGETTDGQMRGSVSIYSHPQGRIIKPHKDGFGGKDFRLFQNVTHSDFLKLAKVVGDGI